MSKARYVPNVTFKFREGDELPLEGGCPIGGRFVDVTTQELFGGKRVVLFALPGAFTPTCSSQQLPIGKRCICNERLGSSFRC